MDRKNSLDILKCIASFMVVYLHYGFNNIIGNYINMICQIAVPIFFIISGYFLYNKNKSSIVNSIKGLLSLLIFSDLFYMIVEISKNLLLNEPISNTFKEMSSVR